MSSMSTNYVDSIPKRKRIKINMQTTMTNSAIQIEKVDLPKNCTWKHGSVYYVHPRGEDGKRRWERLGPDVAKAKKLAARIEGNSGRTRNLQLSAVANGREVPIHQQGRPGSKIQTVEGQQQTRSHAKYVLLPLFCFLTGYSEKAVRRKIEDGIWKQNVHFRKSPDGHIQLDMLSYYAWVEASQADLFQAELDALRKEGGSQ